MGVEGRKLRTPSLPRPSPVDPGCLRSGDRSVYKPKWFEVNTNTHHPVEKHQNGVESSGNTPKKLRYLVDGMTYDSTHLSKRRRYEPAMARVSSTRNDHNGLPGFACLSCARRRRCKLL